MANGNKKNAKNRAKANEKRKNAEKDSKKSLASSSSPKRGKGR